jgi:hypothetical protein
MNLSLSRDHRVVGGWDAGSFMQALKTYVGTRCGCFLRKRPTSAHLRISERRPRP